MRSKRFAYKKIISAVILIFCGILNSCKPTDDPFENHTADTGTEAVTEDGFKDFYSLTMTESYEKYGTFCASGWTEPLFKTFDGKYLYIDVTVDIDVGGGKKTVSTLGRTEYPDGGYTKPVCTDPLCTHAKGSSCPFADMNMFNILCYGGKLYFLKNEGSFQSVCVYSFETNKSEKLLSGLSDCTFYRGDGKFYIDAGSEDENFNVTHVFYRVTEDAQTVKICEYSDTVTGNLIYKEKYKISQAFDQITSDDESVSAVQRPEVIMTDMTTGKIATVFSRPVPELDEYDIRDITVTPFMIYGDLLVIKADFHGRGEDKPAYYRREAWLVDLSSGDKRLLTYDEGEKDFNFICLCSEKMILIKKPEEENGGHFVACLIDPYYGDETEYDLTDAVSAAGGEMPENCYMTQVVKGAIYVKSYERIPYTFINSEGEEVESYNIKTEDAFLYDIESGKTYVCPVSK